MIFKMMLNNAAPGEKSIVRGFIAHLCYGWLIAFLLGALAYTFILIGLKSSIEIPPLFAFAMMAQAGIAGGFLGTVIFVTRIAEYDKPKSDDSPGNAPEPAATPPVAEKKQPHHRRQMSSSPAPSGGVAAAWRS